jgi:hypothetical protein
MSWRADVTAVIVGLAMGSAGVALPACAQDGAASSQPAPMFESAEALLDALETADEGLRTLQSDLSYIRVKALAAIVETRIGRLYFESEPVADSAPPRRRFALDFQQTVTGDSRDTKRTVLLFDGRRLYERDFAGKLMIVRHVVDPNDPNAEARDPMRLGEGPLPIPIGQKKADILAAYRAELVGDLTAGLETPEDPEDVEIRMYESFRTQATGKDGAKAERTVQLRLIARDEDAEFTDIRLWYRRGEGSERGGEGRLLPFMAKAIGHDGDISIFQLSRVRVNDEFSREAEEVMSPETPKGWTRETRDFGG